MERLQNYLNFRSNRFLFLHGIGIQDTFITSDYREISIDEALWQILRKEGFECILFFSHIDRMYFFDESSRLHARPPDGKVINNNQNEMKYFSGPLGKKMIKKSRHEDTNVTPIRNHIGDTHALGIMDSLIRDTSNRTAIIILQAETSLKYFGEQSTLAGRIGQWASLPASNPNICIFLFANQDLPQAVMDKQTSVNLIPELETYFQYRLNRESSQCIYKIPSPDINEIHRLLDYVRVITSAQLDWKDYEHLVNTLTFEGKLASEWLRNLKIISEHNKRILNMKNVRPYLSISGTPWHEQLEGMIGLQSIKDQVSTWQNVLADRKERGIQQIDSLHLAFLGNPGTGKTKVARLIGEMYRDLGLLKRGHTIEADRSKLVAEYEGGTARLTNYIIDQAIGGVLFIDEAYSLHRSTLELNASDPFGDEAIATLLKRMEDDRDQLVVIIAGYTIPIQKLINNTNPGMPSRFPDSNRFIFEDYTPDELFNILNLFINERKLIVRDDATALINEIIGKMYDQRDNKFGNARSMRLFAEDIEKVRANRRQSSISNAQDHLTIPDQIIPDDIPEKYRQYLPPPIPDIENLMSELKQLVGLDDVKKHVIKLVNRLKREERLRKNGKKPTESLDHMLFIGNPGTGKTEVARLMGKIFKSVGKLKTDKVKEISSTDLIAGYVGQTADKAKSIIDEALDGVLFIDEAYYLISNQENNADYVKEVQIVLLKAMEDYSDRLVVIAAGYPREMEQFLKNNSGLGRRFSNKLIFNDFSEDELVEILARKASKEDLIITSTALEKAKGYFNELRQKEGGRFGNASAVENLFNEMIDQQQERLDDAPDEDIRWKTLDVEDVPSHKIKSGNIESESLYYNLAIHHLPATEASMKLQDLSQAVGFLAVITSSGNEGSGTGFIVTPQGHMITAYHVVAQADIIKVFLESDKTKSIHAELVGFDKDADLAILKLTALPDGQQYVWIPLAEAGYMPSLGEKIGVLHYPLGKQLGEEVTFTDGVVSSIRGDNGEFIQISASVTHGSSGAPVFRSSDMKVIGGIFGGVKPDVASGLNFAVNIQLVYRRFGSQDLSGKGQ